MANSYQTNAAPPFPGGHPENDPAAAPQQLKGQQ